MSTVTDELVCDTLGITGSGADAIVWARFSSASALNQYYESMLSSNDLSADEGDCTADDLSGSAPDGEYCQGTYQDDNDVTGNELLYIGAGFDLQGSTSSACDEFGLGGSGATVLAWDTPSENIFGLGLDCTAETSGYADAMESDLLAGNYDLSQ